MNTKTIKKQTWIVEVKTLQQVNRALVLRKLGITEEQYTNLWLDAGKNYLTDVIEVGDFLPDFTASNLFWKWWLNHWQHWDAEFLSLCKQVAWHEIPDLYDETHNVNSVSFRPHKAILEDIFYKKVVTPLTKGVNA